MANVEHSIIKNNKNPQNSFFVGNLQVIEPLSFHYNALTAEPLVQR